MERGGKYYFYYPGHYGDRGGMNTGVAVADSPTGPFREALGRPLVENAHDPAVFKDEDGECYLYFQTRVVRLNDDMISLAEPVRELELTGHTLPGKKEAAYAFRRGDIYYWTMAENFNTLTYWTGDSPYGPFTYRGKIMGPYGGNNHHSIVEYKGRLRFVTVWRAMTLYPLQELVDDRSKRVSRNPPAAGMPHQLVEAVVRFLLFWAQVVLDPIEGDEPCLTRLAVPRSWTCHEKTLQLK